MQVGCILIGSDLRIMPKVIRMRALARTPRCSPGKLPRIMHLHSPVLHPFIPPLRHPQILSTLTSGIKFMSKVFPLEPETMARRCVAMAKVNSVLAGKKKYTYA